MGSKPYMYIIANLYQSKCIWYYCINFAFSGGRNSFVNRASRSFN